MPHILQQRAGKKTKGQERQAAECHTFQHYGNGESQCQDFAEDPVLDQQSIQKDEFS
jgi:hypothetical protein